jgi:hypothetical protein
VGFLECGGFWRGGGSESESDSEDSYSELSSTPEEESSLLSEEELEEELLSSESDSDSVDELVISVTREIVGRAYGSDGPERESNLNPNEMSRDNMDSFRHYVKL